MQRIELIYFNAGGGHRAAAQALERAMLALERPWSMRRINLTEVLDPTNLFRRLIGIEPEDLYNKRLASGFTLGLAQELRLLQAGIRMAHAAIVRRLARHWSRTRPDLVVSLIPNFNRALHDALALARPGVPFVTVMTDMADYPPAFWVEPGTRQHVVCGTAHARAQALAAGTAPQRVHLTSGMILRPEFHLGTLERSAAKRAAERQRSGLDARTPTGLVLFGGTGSNVMKRIASRLPDVPLILMCGHNEDLANSLRALPSRAPRVVVGYTPQVARWMALADFFIGKPGPGSLSEAVQMGLPVIVTRNAWTMPQERWNTDWVLQQRVGVVHPSFRSIDIAVAELLERLPELQARTRCLDNRALFEVPLILAAILDRDAPGAIQRALAAAAQ